MADIYTAGVEDKHCVIVTVCISVVHHAMKGEPKEFIQVGRTTNNIILLLTANTRTNDIV